ncbi:hypothetical protein SO802_006640 [Lithocarpus litseifolius]|uniref:Uncharacterized protein n=1 Tax=Lithocarpus litseifolius TaxID=425828 RepID=A0AAW2DLX3_9ROSI
MEFSADCKPKKYCWRDLELLTNFFSEENFIGKINFGKVYRGKTQQGQEVTVRIWLHLMLEELPNIMLIMVLPDWRVNAFF